MIDSPHNAAVAVTPSDSATIPVTLGVRCGGAGNLRVRMANGVDATFAVIAGGDVPIRCTRIYSTGTTATSIVALY